MCFLVDRMHVQVVDPQKQWRHESPFTLSKLAYRAGKPYFSVGGRLYKTPANEPTPQNWNARVYFTWKFIGTDTQEEY